MSSNTTPQMSTTTNVQPLQNPPCSPYYSGNSGVASNMGPAVDPVFGSGMSGVGPSIGSGGGGCAGGPGGSDNAQFNNQMPVDIPAIGGGIDRMGCPWTGDHFKEQCSHKKGDGARSEKKIGGKSGDQKKKWCNVNKDGKMELTKGGTKYYCCQSCGYGRGRWTSTHKLKNCRYKKKDENESSEEVEEGNFAVEIGVPHDPLIDRQHASE